MQANLTFGSWLKRRRGGLGFTQKELAQQVGYAEVTIRKIEADEMRPSRQAAEKLAEVLQIAPEEREQFIQFARDEPGWDELALPTQAVSADLPSLRTNLPAQSTSFVGRKQELKAVAILITNPNCRLITFLGPGGMGKTRLALQAASEHKDEYPDGVVFVPLISLKSAEFLDAELRSAFSLPSAEYDNLRMQLLSHLREKKLLFVLDNFEHLQKGGLLLADILQYAPNVAMLVTSRERLNLQGEWIFEVGGLEIPPPGEALDKVERYSAVALFMQRARQNTPGFMPDDSQRSAIAHICHLVQGMPLAIQLAAAWVRVLSCVEIAQEIEKGSINLTTTLHDVPPRHRSLQAVFEHSWRLLPCEEQRLFAKLSVFRGSFTLEAAEWVAGASLLLLAALIDKSLLHRDAIGNYEIHEFTRQFAAAKLQEMDEYEETRERHESYFVALAEEKLHRLRATKFHPQFILESIAQEPD